MGIYKREMLMQAMRRDVYEWYSFRNDMLNKMI